MAEKRQDQDSGLTRGLQIQGQGSRRNTTHVGSKLGQDLPASEDRRYLVCLRKQV